MRVFYGLLGSGCGHRELRCWQEAQAEFHWAVDATNEAEDGSCCTTWEFLVTIVAKAPWAARPCLLDIPA